MTLAHIVALGCRTPVGLLPESSSAAIRAGISMVREHPFLVDQRGEPVSGAYDTKLDERLHSLDRIVALAHYSLTSLSARSPLPGESSLPLLLATSEPRGGFSASDAAELERRLVGSYGRLRIQSVRAAYHGHAGGLEALHAAAHAVASSQMEACVVGGSESWFDPQAIAWLVRRRRLAMAELPSGLYPGEGACFVLVVSESCRRALNLRSLAEIQSTGLAKEINSVDSGVDNLGRGLGDAVAAACAGLRATDLVDQVYCDLNGESYRTQEWGLVVARASQWFRDASAYIAPAAQWGDLGAATGAALAMLPIAAWQRHYALGPLALLLAGSNDGHRAAVLLARPSR